MNATTDRLRWTVVLVPARGEPRLDSAWPQREDAELRTEELRRLFREWRVACSAALVQLIDEPEVRVRTRWAA